jgi:hypothetical protein
MGRCKKRPAKGSWHRAQGKASAQANVINVPFRAPFADYTYVAVTKDERNAADVDFPTAS